MTPSQWHDDARNRDAGHDEMQVAVWDYLRDMPEGPSPFYDTRGFTRLGVYFECPFRRGHGQIVTWGDVVEIWEQTITEPHGYTHKKRIYMAWEVKPKIYSVGATIRQCIALKDAIDAAVGGTPHVNCVVMVMAIVMADDPKLAMLRHVFDAAAWNGERLA